MTPILYSFRRCPYAMRARLGLASAGIGVEHREILLRDKPTAMLTVSPKGTVPVLVTDQGVIDESLDIMLWALGRNDPEGWLNIPQSAHDLITETDGAFKTSLDRYKYSSRIPDANPETERANGTRFLMRLNEMLAGQPYLYGAAPRLPDMAIATFVRQFAHVDLNWFNAQPWPDLARWLADFKASARFAAVMQKHPVWGPDARPNPSENIA